MSCGFCNTEKGSSKDKFIDEDDYSKIIVDIWEYNSKYNLSIYCIHDFDVQLELEREINY